jgi:hypothetical protein
MDFVITFNGNLTTIEVIGAIPTGARIQKAWIKAAITLEPI